mgnify:CR=1 FL=1
MKNKSNLVAYGLMSLALILGIFLSVKSVNQTQDTRSSAAGEEAPVAEEVIDGVCGSADGDTVEEVPSDEEACEIGAINWYDSEGADGEYNWTCIGTEDGDVQECTAEVAE